MSSGRMSFRARLLIPTNAMMLIAFIVLGGMVVITSNRSSQAVLRNRVDSAVRMLRASAAPYVYNFDEAALKKMSESLIEDKTFTFVEFLDVGDGNKVMASAGTCAGNACTGEPKDTDPVETVTTDILLNDKEIATLRIQHIRALVDMGVLLPVVGLIAFFALAQLVASIFVIGRAESSVRLYTQALDEHGRQVFQTADRLLSVGENLSGDSQRLESDLGDMASSMERLATGARDSAGLARETNAQVSTAQSLLLGSKEEVLALTQAMLDVSAANRNIEAIVEIIQGIAFQTNLLALNASVEAARAGEHGKGFAVVADAVRSLAQQSAASAKQISGMVLNSVEQTQRGAEISKRVSHTQEEVVASFARAAESAGKILAAAKEHEQSVAATTRSMESVDKISHRNAESARAVTEMSEELSRTFTGVQSEIERLRAIIEGGRAVG